MEWRRASGLSQRALASALGVSQGFIGDIESGRSAPSRNFLQALSEHFRVNPAWILEGREPQIFEDGPGFSSDVGRIAPPQKGKPLAGHLTIDGQDFSLITRHKAHVSAGKGLAAVDGLEKDGLAFSNSWLLKAGLVADLSALVRVRGDSMSPAIPDGATVLVDLRGITAEQPGVYICILDDDVFVKRVHQLRDDKTVVGHVLVSDNPQYPPVVVSGRDNYRLRIVGKVVLAMHTV
nr:XRE family transcriptional regulator [Gemmobacter straminiformis]